eukprot:6469529-Amphidinium_carterae.1
MGRGGCSRNCHDMSGPQKPLNFEKMGFTVSGVSGAPNMVGADHRSPEARFAPTEFFNFTHAVGGAEE